MTLGDKIYQYIFDMKIDDEFNIEDADCDKDELIAILKIFISQDNGRHEQFLLEFSSNYRKLKKVKYNLI